MRVQSARPQPPKQNSNRHTAREIGRSRQKTGPYWDLEVYANQPTFDYVLESLRIGYMLIDVSGQGLWRGNLELLVDASGREFSVALPIIWWAETFFCGGTFCSSTGPKGVPYFQLGAGGLYHDARNVDTRPQAILGTNVEAMLHAGIGTRYHLNKRWSIDGELGYRHISNANTSAHNRGLNSLGGALGLSYFF